MVIHLLYDEKLHADQPLYSKNKEAYHNIQKKIYNCEILFHHIDAPEWLHNLPSVRFYTFGMFLRLFLPEALINVNKVIYLDYDICITADITDLWSFDLDGKAIDVDKIKFNSGVIIFDLVKIRKNYNLSNQTLEFISSHPRTALPDQTALQHIFKNDCVIFDRKWNITTPYHLDYIGENGLYHYIWTKPWKVWRGEEWPEMLFWEYYSKTTWADFPQFVCALAKCTDLSLQQASISAERLLYYPFQYRVQYTSRFIISFIKIHMRELKIRIFDFIRKHEL